MGFDALLTKINDIVERVNTGHCAEYNNAEFVKAYPAALYLQGDTGNVGIYALDAITDTGNGYRIDYRETDRHSGKETHKALCLTFQ